MAYIYAPFYDEQYSLVDAIYFIVSDWLNKKSRSHIVTKAVKYIDDWYNSHLITRIQI
jgi:hypothetical protein